MSSIWPPIDWVRNKHQKNIRLTVKEESIRISTPIYTRRREVNHFINDHRRWIEQALVRQHKNRVEYQIEEDQEKVFISGKWIPFSTELTTRKIFKVDFTNDLRIETDATFLALPLLDKKHKVYKSLAKKVITKEFQSFCEENEIQYNRLFIRSQKTKWGTCSSKGNISFNWRLIKCPEEIRYYLYVHEASHLSQMNHSNLFWKKVQDFDPEFKEHEIWLKQNEKFLFQVM